LSHLDQNDDSEVVYGVTLNTARSWISVSKYFSLKSLICKNKSPLCIIMLTLLVLFSSYFIPVTHGVEWPYCTFNCPASDVGVYSVYIGDEFGNDLGLCTGDGLKAYLWAEIHTQTSGRYQTYAIADIYLGGVYQNMLVSCLCKYPLEAGEKCGEIYTGTHLYQLPLNLTDYPGGYITIPCGSNLSLNETVITWTTSASDTCDYPPQECDKGGAGGHGKSQCSYENNISVDAKPPGSISGIKWRDLDGNGLKDPGDEWLEGWTIVLTNSSDPDHKVYQTTGAGGYYIFEDLDDDTYTVSEVLKPGWDQTYPPGNTYSLTILNYNNWQDVDFGNFFNASYTLNKMAEFDSYQNGTQVNYTIWINNTGKANLTRVSVEDYLEGSQITPLYQTYGDDSDGILNVSEKWRYEFNITVDDSFFGDPCNDWINNTVITNFSAAYNETHTIYIDHQDWANVTIYKCQTADAGENQIVCGGETVFLEGSATCFDAVTWTNDSCLGYLDWPITDDSPLNATYTPPLSGELSGYCNLTLTAIGRCEDVCSNVTIHVVETPNAVIQVIEPDGYS